MSHLFSNYGRWPISIVKGEGNYLFDSEGKKYLDMVSGIAVNSLGNIPPKVKARVAQQLDTLWHCSNLFQIPVQEELANKLAAISGLDRVFFCNSGAEANEAAIKLARKYGNEKGKYEIITFEQSFHGRTLATLTATGQDKVKVGFDPLPAGFKSVPYNDVDSLREAISDVTCAIMMETVQGEGGVHPADSTWMKQVAELCKERDILLIIDEIQTGIGRTGTWFGFQHYGIQPDIITSAKGLGSGFPIGAMLAKEFLADSFGPGSHGSTFGGNPLAMAAGLATLEEVESYLPDVERKGSYIRERLGGRGKGLLVGIDLGFDVAPIITELREKGILALQAGPNVIRLLPPFTISQEELEFAVSTIENVISKHKGAIGI